MKPTPQPPTSRRFPAVLMFFCLLLHAPLQAAPIDLSDTPLATFSAVPPNLMFMIDSSGSMRESAEGTPYDPNVR